MYSVRSSVHCWFGSSEITRYHQGAVPKMYLRLRKTAAKATRIKDKEGGKNVLRAVAQLAEFARLAILRARFDKVS